MKTIFFLFLSELAAIAGSGDVQQFYVGRFAIYGLRSWYERTSLTLMSRITMFLVGRACHGM